MTYPRITVSPGNVPVRSTCSILKSIFSDLLVAEWFSIGNVGSYLSTLARYGQHTKKKSPTSRDLVRAGMGRME